MNNFSSLITGVDGIALLTALVIRPIVSRYRVAHPSEAYIITDRKGKTITNPETDLVSAGLSGRRAIMSGGVFVIPLTQHLHVLDLSSRHIMVQIHNVVSGQDIKPNLDGITIVKVGGNGDSIRAAAQHFLMQQEETETSTQEILADALRSIVGGLSVEQTICDCAALAQRVVDESEASLTGQGLVLDTFQIQDVMDDGTCFSNPGRPEPVKVGQIAAIAEVNTRRKAEQARLAVGQETAISEHELTPKEVEIKTRTNTARTQAATAGPLVQAGRDQATPTEQEKMAVHQTALKDHQLDIEARKPADAKRHETEIAAQGRRSPETFETEARKAAATADAEAQTETARLTGKGKKRRRAALAETEVIEGTRRNEVEKARHIAEADTVRIEDEIKATMVLAVGTAGAEAMNKWAAVFVNYDEAAVLQTLIEVLSQIAEKIATPVGSIDKLTIVSTEGAAALPRQVDDNMLQTIKMIKSIAGIDLLDILKRHTSGKVLKDETAE